MIEAHMKKLKATLLTISLLSLAIAISGFLAWSWDLLPQAGDHGKNWDTWQAAINIDWLIIPWAFGLSVVFAIAFAAVKPRSRAQIIFATCIVIVAAALFGGIGFVMTHLGIG
jgi:FtsH-binding integral membrane protein